MVALQVANAGGGLGIKAFLCWAASYLPFVWEVWEDPGNNSVVFQGRHHTLVDFGACKTKFPHCIPS